MDYNTLESRIREANPGIIPLPMSGYLDSYWTGFRLGISSWAFPASTLDLLMVFQENDDTFENRYGKPKRFPISIHGDSPPVISQEETDKLHAVLRDQAKSEGFYQGLSICAYIAPVVILAAAWAYPKNPCALKHGIDAGFLLTFISWAVNLGDKCTDMINKRGE